MSFLLNENIFEKKTYTTENFLVIWSHCAKKRSGYFHSRFNYDHY